MVEVAEVFVGAVVVSAVVDSAAARADWAAARIVEDPFPDRAPVERGPSAVRPIVAARTAAHHVDLRAPHMAEIAARRSPVAVALQVAQCDPRMPLGPLLTGSGIHLPAHRAGIRRSPVLAADRLLPAPEVA